MDWLVRKQQKGTLTKEENVRVRILNNRTNIANPDTANSVMAHIAAGKTNMKTMNLMLPHVYRSKPDLTEAIRRFRKPVDIICGTQDAPGNSNCWPGQLYSGKSVDCCSTHCRVCFMLLVFFSSL